MPNGVLWTEAFGLLPVRDRLHDTWLTLRGDSHTPKTKFGPSSLRIFRPDQAMKLWLGAWAERRRAVVYNLFNHTPTPASEGWSVRKTQVRDFRGGTLTYDSHNGTDFAIPLGTPVVAPAAARVGYVTSEFNRGGLKVVLDHGDGLVTTHAHLARVLVRPGQRVARGEPFALSGMSGLNGFLFFPWESPHLHMNVLFRGVAVDPFACEGKNLWNAAEPVPTATETTREVPLSQWDEAAIDDEIRACAHPAQREALRAIPDLELRATALLHDRHYYPTRFTKHHALYRSDRDPSGRLALPFSPRDVDGMAFPS